MFGLVVRVVSLFLFRFLGFGFGFWVGCRVWVLFLCFYRFGSGLCLVRICLSSLLFGEGRGRDF